MKLLIDNRRLGITSDEQIRDILVPILQTEAFTIKPVGNHHLKRHLVYQIDMNDGKKYIFKLYYRGRRRSREIASLKILENTDVKCPRIFKYGKLDNGSEWLITGYIEGEILDKVMSDISPENMLKIFEAIGEELGKLHSFKTFDFFGEWDEEGKSIDNIRNVYDYFIKGMEKSIEEVQSQNLPDKEILNTAVKIIRDNYNLFDREILPRLVHKDFEGRNILMAKRGEEGEYELSGVIDFEASYPGNAEENFAQLYYRYFLDNKDYEDAFFKGYKKYLTLDSSFHDRLNIYLLCFVVDNCSWAYTQAVDYYRENIEFLKKILRCN